MECLLLNAKINGIKTICKEVELSFTNKNIVADDFEKNYIKCIYGSNGAGKSGIVHSFQILKYMLSNNFPLKNPIFSSELLNLINKKTNAFSIEVTFAIRFDNDIDRYRYRIELSKDIEVVIKREKLESLNSRLGVSKIIFDTDNFKTAKDKFLNNLDLMSLKYNSLIRVLDEEMSSSKTFDGDLSLGVLSTLYFALKLDVVFASGHDDHGLASIDSSFSAFKHQIRNLDDKPVFALYEDYLSSRIDKKYVWKINKSEKKRYEEMVKRLTRFIRLFKCDLVNIKATFESPNKNSPFLLCFLKFCYKDYDIDYEYESTGTKQICRLFTAFSNASKGNIVIIDEVDAGIHDVIISKLFEFFTMSKPCQIIATTHNIGLMDTLKDGNKSIDVLCENGDVTSWKKVGNVNPSSIYLKGYMYGIPFNLDSMDFYDIFYGGNE